MPLKRKEPTNNADENTFSKTQENLKKTKKTPPSEKSTTLRRSARIQSTKIEVTEEVIEKKKVQTKPKQSSSQKEEEKQSTSSSSPSNPQTISQPLEKRIWKIYYDNTEQKIAIYPGTQASEILKTIITIFSLPEDQGLLFLDEDGIPVGLSSAIPSETKLFMQKKQSFSDMLSSIQQSPPSWVWFQPSNRSTHFRKNNDLTVYQPQNESLSHCFGTLVMKTGKHYFTLLFEPLSCCVFAGIEAAEKFYQSEPNLEWVQSIKLMNLFDKEKSIGLSSESRYEIGFFVDMKKKILKVTNHTEQKVMATKKFDWNEVRPVTVFKHVVSITILKPNLSIPSWIK